MNAEPEISSGDDAAALVIGASGGLGAAFARRLKAEGRHVRVDTLSRRDDGFDIAREESVAAAAARARDEGVRYRTIIVASGALDADGKRPEKAFAEIDPEATARIFAINAIGPALVVKHFAPLLAPKGRSVFAALSARVGSIGDNRLGGWMSYRASKAALNQMMRCAAIEIARTRPEAVVVALHPGTIETRLTRAYARGRYTASPDAAAAAMLATLDRLPSSESGSFFAYDGQRIEW